jgi:hypothetical protein
MTLIELIAFVGLVMPVVGMVESAHHAKARFLSLCVGYSFRTSDWDARYLGMVPLGFRNWKSLKNIFRRSTGVVRRCSSSRKLHGFSSRRFSAAG